MPVVQSGLRAGQKAVPHRCAERPFANSIVHPALCNCRIAFRTSLLGWTPLAMIYMIHRYISWLLPVQTDGSVPDGEESQPEPSPTHAGLASTAPTSCVGGMQLRCGRAGNDLPPRAWASTLTRRWLTTLSS